MARSTHLTSSMHAEPESRPFRIAEVDMESIDVIRALNAAIFNEQRVINSFDRMDVRLLLAYWNEVPVGFKVGYGEDRFTYYGAKGGVLEDFRRRGLARRMLRVMFFQARDLGYIRFAFDTFPNRHPGMTVLGLEEGFRLVRCDYNKTYNDYRLRLEKPL